MAWVLRLLLWSLLATLPDGAHSEGGFDLEQVVDRARQLAAERHVPPASVPRFLRELDYDAWRNIRFDPEQSLWREDGGPFQAMLVLPGLYYWHPVSLNVVEQGEVRSVPFERSQYLFADRELERRVPSDLGHAGFTLTHPLSGRIGEYNQFLVFAGASYFRAVGRDSHFGLSARGLAVDTGLPRGEQFPAFTTFWLVRPEPGAHSMVVYALLEGEQVTGAYRFDVTPGDPTLIGVQAVLFPRRAIELPGLAPLTSMFFHGRHTPRPRGEWRPQVHDSDGLLMRDADSGEWLWRPLINPEVLTQDFFEVGELSGFGLLQRDREFTSYQDLEAHYHRRPSAWVTPVGRWGAGRVVLTQLPTPDETHDNIVAFWQPASLPEQGEYRFAYTLAIGAGDLARHELGQVRHTLVGDGNRIGGGNVEGALRLLVDFSGPALRQLAPTAAVTGQVTALEGSELVEQFVQYNAPCGCWRLSMLVRPGPSGELAVRAYLRHGDDSLTETWSYRLPPGQRRSGAGH